VFPVAELGGAIECPYCAHRFGLTPERLAELADYQASVQIACRCASGISA
jgi:hypothetical protein